MHARTHARFILELLIVIFTPYCVMKSREHIILQNVT